MSDANSNPEVPIIPPAAAEQGELEKSNVQKRIDELTAEKYSYAKQVEQLTNTVADLIKKTTEPKAKEPELPALPEGMDAGVARWMADQFKAQREAVQQSTQQMYWQMQNQMDQQNIAQRNAGMPPEVLKDAANRFTALKQRYGNDATMDDAVDLALAAYVKKQGAAGQAYKYNQMSPAMSMQSHMPNVGGGAASAPNSLVPPTQRADWDRLSLTDQNKLITEFESKGGSLF